MDAKLKRFFLDLQRRGKEMEDRVRKNGSNTTVTDIAVGTFNLACFNNQLLLKLMELMFERDGHHLKVNNAEEEETPTTH